MVALFVAVLSTPACRAISSAPVLAGDPDRYSVTLTGNTTLSDQELLEAARAELVDFVEGGYAKPPIDDAAFAMESRYRALGFARARVDYEYERREERTVVRFLVEEGPRFALAEVVLEGLEAGDASALVAMILPPGDDPVWFESGAVASWGRDIRAWYRARGHLDCEAELVDVALDEERFTAVARVRVTEGVRYTLTAVELDGELALPEAELRATFAAQLGRPFARRTTFEVRAGLEELLHRRGHADASVAVERESDAETGEVTLNCTISPGPRVRISDVRVEGERDVRDGFVRSRMTLGRGDTYDREEERRSFRRLYATGLFREVELRLEGDGPERELVVRVDELPSLEVWMEPGYGSYVGPYFRSGVRERDLLGTARILSLESNVSLKELSGELHLTDPWLFGRDVSADLAFKVQRREEPSFTLEELGAGLFLTRPWSDSLSTTVGYEFRATEVVDTDLEAPSDEAIELEEDVDIAALVFSLTRDRRSNPIGVTMGALDTRGHLTDLSLEYGEEGLGSELDFVRWRLRHARYHPLGERASLALSLRLGAIAPVGDDEFIPLQERFFNGGTDTVRSFPESELGPVDANGEPFGGEGRSVASVELRRQLADGLHGALFWDAGTVALDYTDLLEFDDVRHGVGLGLRYALPIGPVRLDAGWNPDTRDDEDDVVLHFSIGLAY
jgi:outer membrane protein assembly complex protein YaeT